MDVLNISGASALVRNKKENVKQQTTVKWTVVLKYKSLPTCPKPNLILTLNLRDKPVLLT